MLLVPKRVGILVISPNTGNPIPVCAKSRVPIFYFVHGTTAKEGVCLFIIKTNPKFCNNIRITYTLRHPGPYTRLDRVGGSVIDWDADHDLPLSGSRG